MTTFSIVGAGWRTEFFLRVAEALPDRFRVAGVLARDPVKGDRLRHAFGVPVCDNLDDLLRDDPAFVVVSVGWAAAPELTTELHARGVPVLCETPPAPGRADLDALWARLGPHARVQVAEQYAFQPLHAARLAVAASGRIGSVSQAQVSVAHGYHGLNLLRRFLEVGFEDASIRAARWRSPQQPWSGRNGPPTGDAPGTDSQLVAWLEFESGRQGVFDFADSQYFSWIRGPRLLVRGDRGEIADETVRWLGDPRTPFEAPLVRRDTGHGGNLEGYHHAGYTLDGQWVSRNVFAPARLSDDEIAVAHCLDGMARYVDGGEGFYGLADACHDRWLDICLAEAAQTGATVKAGRPAWVG